MNTVSLCFVVAALLGIATCGTAAAQPGPESAAKVADVLQTNKVHRVEIIYFPERILTRVRLTPDMLEKQYRFKLTVNDADSSPVGQELIAAVKAERLTPTDQQADIRWGCSFYSDKDERILSLYFDGSGKAATVGATAMVASGSVTKCLQKICSGFRD